MTGDYEGQSVGDIRGSKCVDIEQTQKGACPAGQQAGNVVDSEDVKIRQAIERVDVLENVEELIAPIRDGLEVYATEVLPQLAERIEDCERLQNDVRGALDQLTRSDLTPEVKLKAIVPMIPSILKLEAAVDVRAIVARLRDRVGASLETAHRRVLEVFGELRNRLGL